MWLMMAYVLGITVVHAQEEASDVAPADDVSTSASPPPQDGVDDASEDTAPVPVLILSEGLEDISEASALDGFSEAAAAGATVSPEELAALPAGLRLVVGGPRQMLRGRFSVRPLFMATGAVGDDGAAVGMGAGGAVLHRWWVLDGHWGGETRLDALTLLGQGSGYQFALASTVGRWWDGVGVHAGPSVRFDEMTWSSAGVHQASDVLLGGRGLVSASTGTLGAFVGGDWAVGVTDARGHEWTALGGGSVQWGWLQFMVRGTWRQAPEGGLWTAGLGVHLQPNIGKRRGS